MAILDDGFPSSRWENEKVKRGNPVSSPEVQVQMDVCYSIYDI